MAPLKIKLPADKKAIAEALGQRLHDYESLTEAHASVLRADPVGYSAAYKKYASLSPDPLGTLPPPSNLDRCIGESEKLLSAKCTCPFECVCPFSPCCLSYSNQPRHLLAMNAGLFLTHALMRKISEDYEDKICLAALGHQTELRCGSIPLTSHATDSVDTQRHAPSR